MKCSPLTGFSYSSSSGGRGLLKGPDGAGTSGCLTDGAEDELADGKGESGDTMVAVGSRDPSEMPSSFGAGEGNVGLGSKLGIAAAAATAAAAACSGDGIGISSREIDCLNGSNRGWSGLTVGFRSASVLGLSETVLIVLMGFWSSADVIDVVVLDPSLSDQPRLLVAVAVATGRAGSAQTAGDAVLMLGAAAASPPAPLASPAVVCDVVDDCLPLSPAPNSQNSAALLVECLKVLLDQLLSSSCQLLGLSSGCLKVLMVDGCRVVTGVVAATGSLLLLQVSPLLFGLRLPLVDGRAGFWNLGGVWYVDCGW